MSGTGACKSRCHCQPTWGAGGPNDEEYASRRVADQRQVDTAGSESSTDNNSLRLLGAGRTRPLSFLFYLWKWLFITWFTGRWLGNIQLAGDCGFLLIFPSSSFFLSAFIISVFSYLIGQWFADVLLSFSFGFTAFDQCGCSSAEWAADGRDLWLNHRCHLIANKRFFTITFKGFWGNFIKLLNKIFNLIFYHFFIISFFFIFLLLFIIIF